MSRKYYVDYEYPENGSIQGNKGFYMSGQTVTFKAVPDNDDIVTESITALMWDDDKNDYTRTIPGLQHPDKDTITFTMPSNDVKVFVSFSEYGQKRIFIRDMEHGTIETDTNVASNGETVTLTIRPQNGYRYKEDSLKIFESIQEGEFQKTQNYNEIVKNSIYTYVIDKLNIEVEAEFEKAPSTPSYDIIISDEIENGTVESDLEEAEEGWTVTLTATPEEHSYYTLQGLLVTKESGESVETTDLGNGMYSFTMPNEAVTVKALFAIPENEIDLRVINHADSRCDVSVAESAKWDDTVIVTVTLRDACQMDSLKVTGISETEYTIEPSSHNEGSNAYFYKFTMPNEPVTVTAEFSYISYPITVDESIEGTVTFSVNGEEITSNPVTAFANDEVFVTYTYENNPGTLEEAVDRLTYTYTTISGSTITANLQNLTAKDNVYTGSFIMPDSDVKIGVKYGDPYSIHIDEEYLSAHNSRVHASDLRAQAGDEITLYAFSNESYSVFATWDVTYEKADGTTATVEVTRTSAWIATFIMPQADVTVRADITPIGWKYIERSWDESSQSVISSEPQYHEECITVTSSTKTLSSGWYCVSEDITNGNRIAVNGTVYLILPDDVTFTCKGGIQLTEGNTLVIYGQDNDSGKLVIKEVGSYKAGIGTNDQDDKGNDTAGKLIVKGGTIDVLGGSDGAGIGGGNEAGGGIVEIYGGTVTAEGGSDAAGIGSGDEAENSSNDKFDITVYGGTVTAQGGSYGAGIGGGDEGEGGTVTIKGGTITATGGTDSAGIGGGENKPGGTVYIYNGTVIANGGVNGAGIGGGDEGKGGTVVIWDGTVHATGGGPGWGGAGGAGIGGGCSGDGGIVTVYGGTVVAETKESAAAGIGGGDRWEFGDAGNGGKFKMYGGKVTATGGTNSEFGGAGIGGASFGDQGGEIEIFNGELHATGGDYSAGIGGGYLGNGDLLTIENGTVVATGGKYGAGIGGGYKCDSGEIMIKGGNITAQGGIYAAGIGGGNEGDSHKFTMTGGTVTAKAGDYHAAGLGGGNNGDLCGDVRISGGTLYTYGTSDNPSIGGNTSGDGIGRGGTTSDSSANIYITGDAIVYAQGGTKGTSNYQRAVALRAEDTLSIYDGAMVYAGNEDCNINSLTLLKASERNNVKTLRSAIIMPCTHPNKTYTITKRTHTEHCDYCNAAFTAEKHTFDAETHTCTICGYVYDGTLYDVTFVPNDDTATGSMDAVAVIQEDSYVLPSCKFDVPGKSFKSWSVKIGDNDPELKSPGDSVTITADTTVTATWEQLTEPEFKSHTLLLSGQIGVNFYMDLSMLSDEERQASFMEFIVNGKNKQDVFDDSFTNPSTHNYYGFTCPINSVQMADEITAILHYGENKTIEQTYSALQYIDQVLNNKDKYSDDAVALVSAIGDYGHYVQPFLAANNGWAIGTDHAEMPAVNTYSEDDVENAKQAVAENAIVRNTGNSQIDAVTYALNLETETEIRIYLKRKEGYNGPVTATVNGDAVDCVKQNDGRYRIEIKGISAHKLGDVYNVIVQAEGQCTVTVSALSYVNTVLYSEREIFNNDDAHYALTSLYKYYDAAIQYQKNQNN